MIGVSLSRDELPSYIEQHQLTLPIVTELSAANIAAYKMGGTPETIVMSNEGKVEKAWMGVYEPHTRKEIETLLAVKLPGCCSS